MNYVTLRFFFDSREAAVSALLSVVMDARTSDKDYSFGSLSASQILSSGLVVYGDAEHLIPLLGDIPGASYYYD